MNGNLSGTNPFVISGTPSVTITTSAGILRCEFEAYTLEKDSYSPDKDAPSPNTKTTASYGCNTGTNGGFKGVFSMVANYYGFANTQTPVVTSLRDSDLGLNYCKFSVPLTGTQTCSSINFADGESHFKYIGVDGLPISPGRGVKYIPGSPAKCEFNAYMLEHNDYPDYDAPIPKTNSAFGCNINKTPEGYNYKSVFQDVSYNPSSSTSPGFNNGPISTIVPKNNPTLGLNYCSFSVSKTSLQTCASLRYTDTTSFRRFLGQDGRIITSEHGVTTVGNTCKFDAYMLDYGNAPDKDAPSPYTKSTSTYGCNSGAESGFKTIFTSSAGFGNTTRIPTVLSKYDADSALSYCAFSIPLDATKNESCASLKYSYAGSNSRFIGLDGRSISSGTARNIYSNVTDIKFTCGAKTIPYNFSSNFTAEFMKSEGATNEYKIIFNPKNNVSGVIDLGKGLNSSGFSIGQSDIQNSEFYFSMSCDSKNNLVTSLSNIEYTNCIY